MKCCRHSRNGTTILQDMAEHIPKERTVCFDKEGCGCLFGDHFHNYDYYSEPVCDVKLSYLSRATGGSVEHLWSMAVDAIVGIKPVTHVLPPALDTCNVTRPEGNHTQHMYCTRDQGFACEVIRAGSKLKSERATVWSSDGCGCDAKAFREGSWNWRKIPNGPRIWTADSFVTEDKPTSGSPGHNGGRHVTNIINGITYKHIAALDIPIPVRAEPFVRSSISRIGKQIWRKRRQVYELKFGSDTFIMQSVSQQVDPMLTDNSGLKDLLSRKLPELDTFGNKVEGGGAAMPLPEGVAYQCRVLAEDLVLESQDAAVTMRDHFSNEYVLADVEAKYEERECVEETERWRLDYCIFRA
mmetsp:Transcript_64766/g.180811  ORF Transcript_64766/g.180811 Transcript_64766/m.180811 type:complete len:355 (+) Transcript_64766:2-1066(+)